MSLVDYASSDEDEAEVREEEEEKRESLRVSKDEPEAPKDDPPPPPLPQSQRPGPYSNQQPGNYYSSEPSAVKLPDASLLFNSPAISSHLLMSGCDHSSRVAAAMAENASRKRDSNGLASSFPRSKVPRGTLPHSRIVPETVGGLLVPPQLSGRSNVVTEDITKLFVRKQAEPSSH